MSPGRAPSWGWANANSTFACFSPFCLLVLKSEHAPRGTEGTQHEFFAVTSSFPAPRWDELSLYVPVPLCRTAPADLGVAVALSADPPWADSALIGSADFCCTESCFGSAKLIALFPPP